MYNAQLEYAGVTLSDGLVDHMYDELADFHISMSETPEGRFSIRMTFPAETLAQAFRIATGVVEQSLARWEANLSPALEVAEVMTEKEFDRREGWDHIPDLVNAAEAAEIIGVSRQRMFQLIEAGRFASVQRLGERTVVPSRAEVRKYKPNMAPHAVAVDSDRREGETAEAYIARITEGVSNDYSAHS